MSLGAVAQSQPQSAPSAPPPASSTPPPQSAPPAAPASADPASPAPVTPPSGQPPAPSSDWRAAIAGQDTKAIEQLSRYKTPADFLNAHNELRGKLSERAAPARLADNATPEQVGEWRKGMGLPDVAKDAAPDAYMGAYKIEAPKGYELNAVEKGMLGDYAKLAYEQGHSPREVKAATDFFFQQQAASQQAVNRLAVDFQKKEQNGLRDELGSAEYEAQQAAGEAWLKEQFAADEQGMADLLNAQMPSGGKLGDSAWFFKLIAGQAMGAGYTDRIEGNALEASGGGKGLIQQREEIEKLQFTDRERYNAADTQTRLDKINAALLARGDIDESGNVVRKRRA